MHIIPVDSFDREHSLRDLLKGLDDARLTNALRRMLGEDARLVDVAGKTMLGADESTVERRRVAVTVELEPLGYIEAAAEESQITAVATLLEQLLRTSARYFMASELHLESVHADYEKLQVQHAALQESEARYKTLAATLEQRVKEQVKTIELAQRQLYQAEKMASVGQLAAGVAHEINNPIGFIRSNLSTAQSYVDEMNALGPVIKGLNEKSPVAQAWQKADMNFVLEDFSELLRDSIHGADRIARIVADLKDFSSVDRTEEETIDLNDVIRSVCNVGATQIKGKAEIKLDLNSLPLLRCKPGHLSQVFMNILLNSSQAIGEGNGEIKIHSESDGNTIKIDFEDTGKGIPEEILSRIFDPFFTTQDVGAGTGLGLTVSRDVVHAHGGEMCASSKVGSGAHFTITLPVRD